MEDRDNSGGIFEGTYNKLISQEDFGADEQSQRVSMSTWRPESSLSYHKMLTVSLAVLAVILLVVDISLGVYYNKITSGNHLVTDIASEMAKLQATYDTELQSKEEARKELAKETSEHQFTKWEMDHLDSRSKSYKEQINQFQIEIASMKSHIPMIEEGCRQCMPGWTFMNSRCYYITFSNNLRKPWLVARRYCKIKGGDLAVIDSRETHMRLFELINNNRDPTKPISVSGYWIGLRDIDEEGIWKWLDGTRLTDGYWNDGEPNNHSNEDCAAMYPRINPFKSWNDAPCSYSLKWICEMRSRPAD
ncbi:CD209 antigen-like [Parambassis ranga]|uniref:CD209 antigen-like n=1 Tax=Parambassis ranga TaxID=210632 RepID=A0A6P7HH65_9TELE|nr:CD209 antigen-like [Parambassis ranga]